MHVQILRLCYFFKTINRILLISHPSTLSCALKNTHEAVHVYMCTCVTHRLSVVTADDFVDDVVTSRAVVYN